MPFAHRDKIKLYYEEEGEGPAVIFINDLIEDHFFWDKIRLELAKNFRVIVFDQRGIGQSSISKTPFTIEDMAKDVIALADELKLETFHLVGDSMGGGVALTVAKKYKDRVQKIVLSNSYLEMSQTVKWSLDMLFEMFKKEPKYSYLYKMAMPWYYSSRFLERDDDPKEILDALDKRKHPLKVSGFKGLLEAVFKFKAHTMIKRIEHETMVIIAEEDIYCLFKDSRALVRGLKNHQVELMAGGHSSKMENPNRYIEILRNFFSTD